MYRWHLFPFNPFWLAHTPTNRQNFSFPQHVAIDSAVSNARDVADENRNAFFDADPVESAISIVFPIADDDDDDDDDDALVERAVPDAPATTPKKKKNTTITTTNAEKKEVVEKRRPKPFPTGGGTIIIAFFSSRHKSLCGGKK
jgi:hypothetical protein